MGVSGERNKNQETPFSATMMVASIGEIAHLRCHADGHPVFRRPSDIARPSWRDWRDHVRIYRERSVRVWLTQDGREFVTRPGDLVTSDQTTAFACETKGHYDYEAWTMPRRLLSPHLPASQLGSLVLVGSSGVAGMVKAYLDAFSAQIDALDDCEADVVADNFCRLLAVAWGASAGEHQDALRLARLEEAKRYIGLHLADPGLTPEKAASALKISVRQLHHLFEPSGTSFAQYVMRRRLEECRAALVNPIGDRSVTDIALGWGFNSLETFHRNFRRAFSATPGEVRGQTKLA
jgi:AraC-like DNA-binding protein